LPLIVYNHPTFYLVGERRKERGRKERAKKEEALPDLLGLLYHVDQQLENRLSLKPHLDAVDNDI
jgi:hypothetical protein